MIIAVFLLFLTGFVSPVRSQENSQEKTVFNDINEAAWQSSNPLGGDFTLFQTEFTRSFFKGDITRTTREDTTAIFQPFIPVGVEYIFGKNWVLGKSVPTSKWGGGETVLALGPTLMFPTASTEEIGTGKYSIGPAAVAGFIGEEYNVSFKIMPIIFKLFK